MESKKHHNILVRIIFVIAALFLLSVAVNAQSPVTNTRVPMHKKAALNRQLSLTDYELNVIDTTLRDIKVNINTLSTDISTLNTYYDPVGGGFMYNEKLNTDSLVLANRCYLVVHTFSASSAAGAYSNLTTINSSTVATTTVPSHSVYVPSGKYQLIAVNIVLSSTATPIYEGWIFSGSVTTAGDKQNVSALSDTDMKKFMADFRIDGTFVGNGGVFKSTGRVGSYSAINIPVYIDITGDALHYILVARGSWTPSANAQHKIAFHLKRVL